MTIDNHPINLSIYSDRSEMIVTQSFYPTINHVSSVCTTPEHYHGGYEEMLSEHLTVIFRVKPKQASIVEIAEQHQYKAKAS